MGRGEGSARGLWGKGTQRISQGSGNSLFPHVRDAAIYFIDSLSTVSIHFIYSTLVFSMCDALNDKACLNFYIKKDLRKFSIYKCYIHFKIQNGFPSLSTNIRLSTWTSFKLRLGGKLKVKSQSEPGSGSFRGWGFVQPQRAEREHVLVAQSCPTLRPRGLQPARAPLSMGFSRQDYRSGGSHYPLQGIFPTQESNLSLPHGRQILYHLSHQGSPKGSLGDCSLDAVKRSRGHANNTEVGCREASSGKSQLSL